MRLSSDPDTTSPDIVAAKQQNLPGASKGALPSNWLWVFFRQTSSFSGV